MKKLLFLLAAIVCCLAAPVFAISFGGPGGEWPASWPKELEPLRKQAWTWEHDFNGKSFDIPFTSREEFEAAWPHLLSLRSEKGTLTLLRGPRLRVDGKDDAGVCVLNYPIDHKMELCLRLVVDAEIVDLNRIRLPKDTVILDERFGEDRK
jgi:hypothetical protein